MSSVYRNGYRLSTRDYVKGGTGGELSAPHRDTSATRDRKEVARQPQTAHRTTQSPKRTPCHDHDLRACRSIPNRGGWRRTGLSVPPLPPHRRPHHRKACSGHMGTSGGMVEVVSGGDALLVRYRNGKRAAIRRQGCRLCGGRQPSCSLGGVWFRIRNRTEWAGSLPYALWLVGVLCRSRGWWRLAVGALGTGCSGRVCHR